MDRYGSEIVIKINLENDAFQDDMVYTELGEIFRDLAAHFEAGRMPRTIRDENGNNCGSIQYKD